MATQNALTSRFEAIQRQYRTTWTLPPPDALARAVDTEARVRKAVDDLTALLDRRRITFAEWQRAVEEALRRGGINIGALLAGAAVGLAGARLASALRTTPEQALNALATRFTARTQALTAALAQGRIDVQTWRAAFAAELQAYHPAAAIAGAGGARSDAVLALGRQRAAEQMAYLDAWATQMAQGGVASEKAMLNRATLYADASHGTFERGQAVGLGLVLPVYPGDGRCRVRCRCRWDIRREATGWRCRWVVDRAAENCVDCLAWGVQYANLFIETEAA